MPSLEITLISVNENNVLNVEEEGRRGEPKTVWVSSCTDKRPFDFIRLAGNRMLASVSQGLALVA